MVAALIAAGIPACADPSAVVPPTLRIMSPQAGDTILAGDSVLFRVEIDGETAGDPLSIEWATEWGRILGHGDSVRAALPDSGAVTVVALARAGDDLLATERVPVTVIPNGAPTVTIDSIRAPCLVYITDTVRLVAHASDPESSSVRIAWSSDASGIIGDGDTLRWVPGPGAEGARVIAARAFDPQGNRADALAVLHVLGGARFKWARTYSAPEAPVDCGGQAESPSPPLALADDGTIFAGSPRRKRHGG
jgi:hypothetical protein